MSEFNRLSEKQTMLHKALIHDYEEKIKIAKAEREIMGQYKEKRGAQIREIMSRSNFDMAAIEQLRKDDVRESKEFLDRVRPSLANRAATKNNHAQDRAKRSSIIVPGQQIMPVHSATLLASTGSSLENNPGEKGNPWILPWNPGQIRIKAADTPADNWGCGYLFGDPTYGAYTAQSNFFFTFIPDTTGNWFTEAQVNLSGFYILRADDSLFTCKECKAKLEIDYQVYQYYWSGYNSISIIDRDEGNVNEYGLIDQNYALSAQVALKAGDWVFIMMTVKISAWANGGGSYSEINFSDGTQNFIEPFLAIAFPN
jgi:hypothetical protein